MTDEFEEPNTCPTVIAMRNRICLLFISSTLSLVLLVLLLFFIGGFLGHPSEFVIWFLSFFSDNPESKFIIYFISLFLLFSFFIGFLGISLYSFCSIKKEYRKPN